MQDWTYESLIRKLKATLAEVERETDPPPAEPSPDRADGQETLSAAARSDTIRPVKRTRKA